MKVRELVDKLGLKVLSGENGLDREIDGCYVSDLLSDVMGNADGTSGTIQWCINVTCDRKSGFQ